MAFTGVVRKECTPPRVYTTKCAVAAAGDATTRAQKPAAATLRNERTARSRRPLFAFFGDFTAYPIGSCSARFAALRSAFPNIGTLCILRRHSSLGGFS